MGIEGLLRTLRLNAHVMGLGASKRRVGPPEIAAGYDRAAPDYDQAWTTQVDRVTRDMIARLPEIPVAGSFLDLGCGTGFGTSLLSVRYPGRAIQGSDISAGMLAAAHRRPGCDGVTWRRAEMLDVLSSQPAAGVSLIVATWSLGYADWRRVVWECRRVLASEGCIGLIVNLADTLAPVRRAFLHTMREHPGSVQRAYVSTFPPGADAVRSAFAKAGLRVGYSEEGTVEIRPSRAVATGQLDWLLKTGVLAGFDSMLPLRDGGPVARTFEAALDADPEPIVHHYLAAIAHKP